MGLHPGSRARRLGALGRGHGGGRALRNGRESWSWELGWVSQAQAVSGSAGVGGEGRAGGKKAGDAQRGTAAGKRRGRDAPRSLSRAGEMPRLNVEGPLRWPLGFVGWRQVVHNSWGRFRREHAILQAGCWEFQPGSLCMGCPLWERFPQPSQPPWQPPQPPQSLLSSGVPRAWDPARAAAAPPSPRSTRDQRRPRAAASRRQTRTSASGTMMACHGRNIRDPSSRDQSRR